MGQSQEREWATLRGHNWNIAGVMFSADSRLLASYSWEGECRLWDVEKGAKASLHLLRGHRAGLGQAIFSTDGRTLATSSGLSSRKLWSVATGQELLSFPSPQVIQGGGSVPIMSPKGNYLIWGSDPLQGDTEKEGIEMGKDKDFFVGANSWTGNLSSAGAIYKGNLETGEGIIIVPPTGKPLAGLSYDVRTDYLYAATGFSSGFSGP